MIHHVRLDQFDGPIELLIYLVRNQELDIGEIPIARITDQYLDFIRDRTSLNIDQAAEFLLMAVVLIRLKMRSLFPRPAESLETGTTVNLDEIVAEFQRYRHAAELLSGMETDRRNLFPRSGAGAAEFDAGADVMLLTQAFRKVISKLAPKDDWVVERVQLRIEERLAALRAVLAEQRVVDFLAYLAALGTVPEVVITFLAALELARLGEIRVSQDEETGAINLFRRAPPGA